MTRPAEYTRQSIIKAAVHLFAEKGFENASVRDIVTKARVNQAAINYHFKGKNGLYLEVLKTAFEKLTKHAGFDPEKLKSLSREEALRSFVSQQLRPLLFRDELSLYIRMFAWESAHPSKIFLKFMATNTVSYLTAAVDIVRQFLPPGTQKRVALSLRLRRKQKRHSIELWGCQGSLKAFMAARLPAIFLKQDQGNRGLLRDRHH
jgi:AcrR family transcriptional regulator